MRRQINNMLVLILFTLSAANVKAETAPVNIPEKVKADILKRHPKAIDMQASHEIHFKRHLLEVSFKEEGNNDPILELFREDGHLFTNELLVEDLSLGEAPAAVKTALEENFAGYRVDKAEMIANPNGAGEEYEIYLQASNVNWKVSVTEKGEILEKNQY
ncbi:MAG: hypothetical protein ABSB19_02740 [Methylomonas sp.]|jgi:hypothetical protein